MQNYKGSASGQRCPDCGQKVKRVMRNANDKRRWDADEWRRYRCRSDTCGWQGLLQFEPDDEGPEAPTTTVVALRMLRWLLLLAMVGGLTWGGVETLQLLTET